MHHQQQEEDEKPVVKKFYTQKDLLEFETPNMYSSVGKMTLSQKPSAPSHGFGTSTRQKQQKVFHSQELSKTQFIGKTSPGPNYEVRGTDGFYYKDDPKWTFGKEVRNTLNTGAKHAFYTRRDDDFDPITADNSRKWRSGSVKIGLESRFTNGVPRSKATPGPDYNPGLKPDLPRQAAYSFGVRREIKGQSAIVSLSSTPNQVGPGSYLKQEPVKTSIMPEHPEFSFPKDKKHKPTQANFQKNQTFDTRSSIGAQATSKNRTMATISIGKAKRDAPTGIFKDHMSTQPTRIRIQQPRF